MVLVVQKLNKYNNICCFHISVSKKIILSGHFVYIYKHSYQPPSFGLKVVVWAHY